jgi:hypothetical protein
LRLESGFGFSPHLKLPQQNVPGRRGRGQLSSHDATPNKSMGELEMAVRTTVVGSWWIHPEMEQDLARYHAGELSPQEGEAVLNRAAAKAIEEQRELGLDEWTGGEYTPTISSCTCTSA